MCWFTSIAKYGHSDHETEITIEVTSKNHSRTEMLLYIVRSVKFFCALGDTEWNNPHF